MFYEQPPEQLLKLYLFQPLGSSTTAIKEVRAQQIMQAYQLFNQDPMINQIELRKMVFDVLDIKNVNKLLIEQPAQPMPPPGTPGMGGGPPSPEGQPPMEGSPGGVPTPPQPPEPGQAAFPAERQVAELARVMGGGLVKGGPATPQNVSIGGPAR